MDVRAGLLRQLSAKELSFWTVVLEKTLESLLNFKVIQPVNPKGDQSWNIHWKDWCWSWKSNTLATWCEEPAYWKIPCCWERLKAGEGDDSRWDSWMALLAWWTWVWASSRSWWWPRKPGVLQPTRSQRVGHEWVTEQILILLGCIFWASYFIFLSFRIIIS